MFWSPDLCGKCVPKIVDPGAHTSVAGLAEEATDRALDRAEAESFIARPPGLSGRPPADRPRELAVDGRRFRYTMPQHITDHLQRDSSPKERGCPRVAERMRSPSVRVEAVELLLHGEEGLRVLDR